MVAGEVGLGVKGKQVAPLASEPKCVNQPGMKLIIQTRLLSKLSGTFFKRQVYLVRPRDRGLVCALPIDTCLCSGP